MSDLSSASARTAATSSVNTAGLARLRRSQTLGQMFGDQGQLDAFAEIFANMSIADPVRAQPAAPVESGRSADNSSANEDKPGESVETDDSDGDQGAAEAPIANVIEAPREQLPEYSPEDADVQIGDDHGAEYDPTRLAIKSDTGHEREETHDSFQLSDGFEPTLTQDIDHEDRRQKRKQELNVDQELVPGPQRPRTETDRFRIEEPLQEIAPRVTLTESTGESQDDLLGWKKRQTRRDGNRSHRAERPGFVDELANMPKQTSSRSSDPIQANVSSPMPGDDAKSNLHASDPVANSTRPRDTGIVPTQQISSSSAAQRGATSGQTGGPNASTRGGIDAVGPVDPAKQKATHQPKKSRSSQDRVADTVSRVKLIQRVSKAFQHLGPDGGVVRLRLAPAELGSVRVEMRIHQRKIRARVIAETEAAGTALREHLPDLRHRLESQGMQIERLSVESESDSATYAERQSDQHQHGHLDQRQRRDWSQGDGDPPRQSMERQHPESVSQHQVSRPYRPMRAGGLDVTG